jgi:nicotinamide-nucleotide amidase
VHWEVHLDLELYRLAESVGQALKGKGWLLATAESCTGGWIGEAVTAVPGSSDWFERGFITYSNAAKQEMLGVRSATLEQHGAVSEPTVLEMVTGAVNNSRAALAVSVSGVAGPAGGTAAKPVGMVCIGWCVRGSPPFAVTKHFAGDRESVRRQSVVVALEGVLEAVRRET